MSGGKDLTVRIWQLDAGETRAPTQQHDGWIHAVALAGDGSLAVTAGQDRIIRLWDATTGRVTRELKCAATSPDLIRFSIFGLIQYFTRSEIPGPRWISVTRAPVQKSSSAAMAAEFLAPITATSWL